MGQRVCGDLLWWVVHVIECLVAVRRGQPVLNPIITGPYLPARILLETC